MKYLLALVLLAACGKDSGFTGVDIGDPSQLVGSYGLAVYAATGPADGSLELRSDSTFSLSAPDGWGAMNGKWSWTGGNVYLVQQNVYGSLVNSGLGFTKEGLPALFFRKR